MPDSNKKTTKKRKKKSRKKKSTPKSKKKSDLKKKSDAGEDGSKTPIKADKAMTSFELRAEKERLRRRLLELEVKEKSTQAKELAHDARQNIISGWGDLKRSEHYRVLMAMPEPLKYSLIFVVLSLITVFVGAFIFSMLMLISPQGSDVAAQSPTSTTTSTTSTTSSTSSTTTTTSSSSTTVSTLPEVICNPPYMRLGMGCCLDSDGNSICDKDQQQATTTSTLSDYVRCEKDIDCGPTRTEYYCQDGDVYKRTVANFCKNAGTLASSCESNVVEEMVDHCSAQEYCTVSRDGIGRCKNKYASNNFLD